MELNRMKFKKELASSTNQSKIFNSEYTIDNICFKIGELEKIYKFENEEIWRNILQQLDGVQKSLVNYLSEENIPLFGKQYNNKILVISAGEVNRGVYKIFLEGIWTINLES
jgi:hypothetical protein